MRRVIFLGTPQTAVPSLEALAAYPDCRVAAVFTQPGRAAGRGRSPRASPVRQAAEALGLPVIAPAKIGSAEGLEALRDSGAELGVVCAYGQILSDQVLELPPLGWFNLHFSLLPRWRGASPVQAAILAGDAVTGVSLQRVVAKLDAGPIAAETAPMPIGAQDTAQTLGERLAGAAAELLRATLPALLAGEVSLREQVPDSATFCRTVRKEAGAVDWERETAEQIARKARAYFPWPGCYGFLAGRRLGLLKLEVAQAGGAGAGAPGALPGTLLPGGLVPAREGLVRLLEVKPEGKGAMPLDAFLRGARMAPGVRITPAPAP